MTASSADLIKVRWPSGDELSIPALWLRDSCPCPDCRVEQTQEKRFHLANLTSLSALNLDANEQGLSVQWSDGHKSYFERSFFDSDYAQPKQIWRPWSDDFLPGRYDFEAFQTDNAYAAQAIGEFLETGVLIIENAPTEDKTLERMSPRFGPIREVLFERIHNVKVDPKGYNVAHTSLGLPPHNDFASYSWPPSVQALHMLGNEAVGGNSTICDGWAVLEEFRRDHPEEFDTLCRVAVPFREFDEDNETFACEPIITLNPRGEILSFRYSNQLMQTMDFRDPETAVFYDAYYKLSRALLNTRFSRSFRLNGGEMLVVASHRILHGREAITSSGYRHLQDAYFEHDNIRNMLTVLKRSHV